MSYGATEGKRRRRRGFGLWMLLSLALLTLVAGLVAFALLGRSIEVPNWVKTRIETSINQSLAGGRVGLGAVNLQVSDNWVPVIRLDDLLLEDRTGLPIASFSDIEVTLAMSKLVEGVVQPTALMVRGAEFSMRREPNGRFDLSLDDPEQTLGTNGSLSDVLKSIDRLFATPQLAAIENVQISDVTFQYEDARAARYWVATDGVLELTQDPEKLDIRLGFELFYGQDTPAEASLSFRSFKGSPRATISANLKDVPADDFATQAPALAWLAVIDAPVSGAVRAEISEDGELGSMNGTLEIGKGVLQPTEQTRPIGFNTGKAYFTYDPDLQKITFSELSVSTDAAELKAEGKAYLRDLIDGWPSTLLAQFSFSQISANPVGIFVAPVSFDGGALDIRLRLDPFSLTIGQLVLIDGDTHLQVRGGVAVDEAGWAVALDLNLNEIQQKRLMELWPVVLISKTRDWLEENVYSGHLSNVTGALRLSQGQDVRMSFGFRFHDATVRYMRKLPPVEQGNGYATISDKTLSLVVENGIVTAPNGGLLDATGTVFSIPDVFVREPPAVVALRAKGTIPSVLSLLDEPPFEFLSKADQPTDLAEGVADVQADIRLPLADTVLLEDVDFEVSGQLQDVTSDKLVQDRVLSAPELALRASPDGIEISGMGKFGSLPFNATWTQGFGEANKGRSQVEGTVELSQVFVNEFNLGLPDGSISGVGRAAINIELLKDAPSLFTLTSDLNQLGMRLNDLGWAKPRDVTGELLVSGSLGNPVRIELLKINAAGLDATGSVTLKEGGALDAARFSSVQVGQWLNAPVVLRGRGIGLTPAVSVEGGMIDIRQTTFGRGGGTGQGGPISLALDRLVVSEGITLTGLRGNFQTSPAFNGTFQAKVNGQVDILGTLAPQEGGTAIRIRSSDAGAVMRAAGVLDKAHGGDMDLILIPLGETGSYNGRLTATTVRVRDAPALADLLGAISVIGLLEQLNGQGIVFSDVEANFRLTPTRVIITRGSAVGASLGVSMDGVYSLGTKLLDMQGVISPVYIVNGIGAIFTRRGEGIFGFNYRLTGSSDDPSVSVNPLSIFTPGMFREIFRRPPPKVDE
ncbi:DUF3971 domain-containing protein [Pseudohalocynthiibacter aestuariivivens]|uniref:DUF3971 domain-containing protein n=1 Tax=Pseudohalocynthiibacter aestuariivivens TaxID=1591409 RepID=A0ABV5JCJ5_9RHOB|nr:DUF3971 domain-containing protein [Pseudohalocynthiibacter aestuariivivens]MBS9718629.1 hypothetical protein [Pseudohalocynthiibacter aestuariivivens]